jgi:hypothetical protein
MDDTEAGLFLLELANNFLGDRGLADAAVTVETDVLAFEEVLLDGVEDGSAADEGRGCGLGEKFCFPFGFLLDLHGVLSE